MLNGCHFRRRPELPDQAMSPQEENLMAEPALDLLLQVILDVVAGSSRAHGSLERPCRESWPRTQGPQVSPDFYGTLDTALPPVDLVSPPINGFGLGSVSPTPSGGPTTSGLQVHQSPLGHLGQHWLPAAQG